MEPQTPQKEEQQTNQQLPLDDKSQYHAVLRGPDGEIKTVASPRKFDLSKKVAEMYSECEVVGLFKGKKIKYGVRKQIKF